MSRFLDSGNMRAKSQPATRKRKVWGTIESTDYVWRYSAMLGEMTTFKVDTIAVPRSLEPVADTRTFIPRETNVRTHRKPAPAFTH